MAEVVKVQVVADTNTAKQQLQDLQTQLQNLSAKPVNINDQSLVQANKMAIELQQNLQKAMNPNTGKLDLSVFSAELAKSKRNLNDYATALKSIGPEGQQAFLTLSRTIAMAEAPTSRLNASLMKFGQTIKNTINWQISSSLIHGVVGQVQSAINYAEKLNTSLTNIRIVTNQNNEQMAKFAEQANQAARRLNTTTTAYTNASLIYYQQGLGDKEVAERTETTLKLANVSKQSVETVSSQLTAIWNNYAEGSGNLEHYADVITALGAATASSSQEIATGLQKFAAVGKTVGLSYDYATTALATVTATTRQSADTVGTGLRTLFSRLQGLKLGDTLEDGVNLNKYSAALATVGVNIQDQYGKVKDMDQILDELGSKWQNISKEQQIALAQTVGGVRQYTNLIALMDNWDKFQQNLTVAQGADGTLQRQADIYGESWEAASKRARASIESIYSSLIDDQVVIKLIDGFASFMDIIHGITEGLGGMKGVLLTVASIFMSQYAKNIPQVLTGIKNGFQSFIGIGMVRTPYGKMDKDTYQLQKDNETLLAATAKDTSLTNAERISAQGSLALSRMNAAYQNQRRFMTADEQAAEELRIKNAEASYNSMAAQARANEQIDKTSEKELQEALKEAQKPIRRSADEQDALNQAFNDAAKAVTEAKNHVDESTDNFTKANDAVAEIETKVASKQQEVNQLSNTLTGFQGHAKYRDEIEFKRDYAQLELEDLQQELKTAQEKAHHAQEQKQQAQEAYNKAQAAKDEADQASKPVAQIIKEREDAAQKLWESQPKNAGKKYITPEEAQSNPNLQRQRAAQQDQLFNPMRELYKKEALYADTVDTAKNGLKRFDADLTVMKGRKERGELTAADEAEFLARAKDKGIKYKDNLKAAISEKYDEATAKALNKKIDENAKKLDTASSVEEVKSVAEAIAAAIKKAIDEGLQDENKNHLIEDETTRGEEMGKVNRATAKATGLTEAQVEGYGEEYMRGQAGDFERAMNLQDLQNPPDTEKPKPLAQTDPFGALVSGMGQVAASAASVAGGLSAVSNAFNILQDDSASFATKLGVVGGALASLKNVGDVTQNAADSIGKMIGKAAPGWIGAAVSVATTAVGLIKGHFDKLKQEEQERRQEMMDNADAKNKEVASNKELLDNNAKLIESYNDMKKAGATMAELAEQQTKILEASQAVGEAYNITGLSSSIMGGKMEQAQALIDKARLKELQEATATNEQAKEVAGKNLQETKKKGINRYVSGEDESEIITEIGYGALKSDETQAYAVLNKYESLKNGILAKDAFKDADTTLATYEDLMAAYEEMQTTMTSDQQSGSEVFKNTKKLIDSISEQAEAYKTYKDQINEYGIEMTALSGIIVDNKLVKTSDIKDLESYENYRQELIKTTAQARGITKTSSKEYEDLVKSVDAYLGTLTSVTSSEQGNLQQISKGLDDIVETQAALEGATNNEARKKEIKGSLKQLYEQYGNAVFELDTQTALHIPVDLNADDLSGRLKTQLELLQAIADANTIKAQIELATNFNLTDKNSFSEWGAFAKSVNAKQKDEFGKEIADSQGNWERIMGTAFDVGEFSALSAEEQKRQMNQYKQRLNAEYYGEGGEFEQVQAKREADYKQAQADYEAAKVTQKTNATRWVGNSQMGLSGQKVLDNAAALKKYNELKQLDSEGKLNPEGQKQLQDITAGLAKNGITESAINGFGAFINEILASTDALNESEASMQRANEAIEEGKAEREAYTTTGFRQALMDEADQWGINYDDVKAYASALRENGTFTQDQIEASEKFALEQKKVSTGIDLVSNNLKIYQKELKAGKKGSEEYTKSLTQIKKGLSGILGVPIEEISDEFVEAANDAGLLADVMNDVEGAVDKVYQYAGDRKLAETMGIKPEDIANLNPTELHDYLMANLTGPFKSMGDELQTIYDGLPKFKPGDLIDDAGIADAATSVMSSFWQMSGDMQSAIDAMESMGLHPTLTEVTASSEGHNYITATGVKLVPDGNGGFQTEQGEPVQAGSESEGGATIYELTFNKKGGGGGGSSGGGGGGQKKKDHKKPNAATRYHTIKAKQSNNNQNKQEANRQKERDFGTAKIKQAEKEIELQKESIELQKQYIDEIKDYLPEDRQAMEEAFSGLGITLDIDGDNVITNFKEVEEELLRQENELIDRFNNGELSDEEYQELQKKIDEAREAMSQFEETADLLEEQELALAEQTDALKDQYLELTQMEIKIQLDVSTDRFEYLDYLLSKIDDDAYSAAEAISLLGDKTAETMKKVNTITTGLQEILAQNGISIEDLDNMSAEDLEAAGFTQAQIDQIREWRSELLKANQDLLKMRDTIVNKVIDSFNELNDKIAKEVDNFDFFNSVLENYKNISNLLGNKLGPQQQAVIEKLNASMITNARNRIKATKDILNDAQVAEQKAQAQYAEAMKNWANLSDDDRRRAEEDWKKILEAAHDNVEEATQQWLEAWEGGLELAQDLFEETMEKLVTDYNKTMGGTFGNLDYLQEAYERQKDISNQYVQDYEKLYQLSQLSRDISKSIDDTDSIKSKERLRALQKEINALQMSNTKMSEYDLEVLRKRFELEQARLNLGEAKNSKSQVRLQRDSEGNWGYVYTADEDEVAKAEEEYENKLYEYQKLNHEYITQLQDDMTNLFGEYRDAIANILNDLTLSPEEVQANIEQIMGTLGDKLPYLYEQLQAGFTNQESLRQLFIDAYGNEGAQMVDTWGETILSMFSEGDSLEDFINKFRNQLQTLVTEGITARQNLEAIQDGMNDDAEVSTTDFADHISEVTINIDSLSGDTLDTIEDLTDVLNTEFASALAAAVEWEIAYTNNMNAMITSNEHFVSSLNVMIEKLAGIYTGNVATDAKTWFFNQGDKVDSSSLNDYDKDFQQYQEIYSKYLSSREEEIKAYQDAIAKDMRELEKSYDLGQINDSTFKEAKQQLEYEQEKLVDYWQSLLDANIQAYSHGLGNLTFETPKFDMINELEQQVTITAEFPNATNHSEIEEAFTNLVNKASQYANRKGI